MFEDDPSGGSQDPREPAAPTPAPDQRKRYNTTPNWLDPYNPPSPGDPYWAEWIQANPDYQPPTSNHGWPTPPGPTPPPGPAPPPGPNPLGQSPGDFIAPQRLDLGGPAGTPPVPTFSGAQAAPDFPNIPRFAAPTAEEAMSDPGYKFVFDQGENALQNWAAARGTLNDSGTANALQQFGQAAAGQQYRQVWDRDFSQYQNDVQNQYISPFQAKYRTWSDSVLGPSMLAYSTQSAAAQHLNDTDYAHAWDRYLTDWANFRDQRDTALRWTLQ